MQHVTKSFVAKDTPKMMTSFHLFATEQDFENIVSMRYYDKRYVSYGSVAFERYLHRSAEVINVKMVCKLWEDGL